MTSSVFDILRCSICTGGLSRDGDYLICASCWAMFPIVGDIAVLLTEDDRPEISGQTGGHERQRASVDIRPGFMFVSNESSLPDLRAVYEKAASEGKAMRLLRTDAFPETRYTSAELDRALQSGRERVVDHSRAQSSRCILNWPSGWGYSLHHLMSQVSQEALVVAMDADFRTLASIQHYYDGKGLPADVLFVAANALKMPFRDGVFQSVIAADGSIETENADGCLAEIHRVLEDGGWVSIAGDVYTEGSASMAAAEYWGLDSLATTDKLRSSMTRIGFTNITHEVLYEGLDRDDGSIDDEERCPLPARGDWFQHIAAAGQRLQRRSSP